MATSTTEKKPAKKPVTKKEEKSMKDLYSTPAASVAKTTSKAKEGTKSVSAYRVLVKPMITEKAADLGTKNKYVFMVSMDANKIEVAKAINSVYGVKVEKVNLIRQEGKTIVRGRVKGKRKDFKKAIVTLAKGNTISIYEGV
jgi:large subunit ribosomal protein L23